MFLDAVVFVHSLEPFGFNNSLVLGRKSFPIELRVIPANMVVIHSASTVWPINRTHRATNTSKSHVVPLAKRKEISNNVNDRLLDFYSGKISGTGVHHHNFVIYGKSGGKLLAFY
jgi:hypothetical protein